MSQLRFRSLVLFVSAALMAGVISASAQSLTLAWDRNPEPAVTGYIVYVGVGPGSYSERLDVGDVTRYDVTADAGRQYCFAVAAYQADYGEGERSAEVCTTSTTTPTTNTAPSISNPGSQSSPVGQVLTVGLSGADPEGDPLTYSVTGLPAGLTVAPSTGVVSGTPTQVGTSTVTVTLSDGTLSASLSFEWSITGSTPGAAELLGPTGAITTTTPAVEWTPVATATSYRVWVDDAGTNQQMLQDVTPTDAGCALPETVCRVTPTFTLVPGPASWSVRATNTVGDGPWSGSMDFTVPGGVAPAISIVTPTTASTYSTGTATLTVAGTASDNVGVTEVRWASSQGASGVATGTANWSVSAIALAAGSNTITVTARNANGNTATSVLTVTKTEGQAPTVGIFYPTTAATYSTTSASVILAGSAADYSGITEVRWANSQGGSGIATGKTNWSVSAVPLTTGSNIITVTARNANGNTGTSVLTVTRTGGQALAVGISVPTTAATYSTTNASLALGGTAADDTGVTEVRWANSQGGSGIATGTANWSVGAIPLTAGANTITVTARDASGMTATDVLTVTRADGQPPTVGISLPTAAATYSTTNTSLVLSGTAADDIGVTEVRWANSQGGSGIATGTANWSVGAIPLTAGANTITVTARDADGKTATGVLTVTRADGQPPTVGISLPTAAATYSTTNTSLVLGGTAADDIGVTEVRWANSRGGSGVATGTANWSVGAIPLTAGANTITVTARDADGKTATGVLTVTRADGQPPTVGISLPTAAATYSTTNNSLVLGGTAADDIGVTEVRWANSRGGSGIATGTANWSVGAIPLTAGANVITVTVRDADGKTATGVLTVTRADAQPPTVGISLPTAAATYTTPNASLVLGGTAADDVGVTEVRWANSRGGSGVATGTASWSVGAIPLTAGSNVITVTVRDADGKTATDVLTVTRADGQPPTVGISLPTAAATYTTPNASLVLGGTTADDIGVTEVRWANSQGGSGIAAGTANWSVSAIPLTAGANTITVTARDAAGNSAISTLVVTAVDNAAPTVKIAVANSKVTSLASTIVLNGTAADTFGVTEVSWSNNRGGSGVATGTKNWSISGIPLQPGSNAITVSARDAAGQVGTERIAVTRTDGEAPTVSLLTPTSGGSYSTSSKSVTLGGTAADAFGVSQVTWTNNRGGSGTAAGTSQWSITGVALQPGTNVITIAARDAANNTGQTTLSVTLADVEPPTVTIASPVSAATFSTTSPTVSLAGKASDASGVTDVTWSNSQGGSGTATGTASWSVQSVPLLPGLNVITVVARDSAGNIGRAQLTIKASDKKAPVVTLTPPADQWLTNGGAATQLRGTASDDFGVASVTWRNGRGGSGVAVGTTSWQAASVPLQQGTNDITITAIDKAGNSATSVVMIDGPKVSKTTSATKTVPDTYVATASGTTAGSTSGAGAAYPLTTVQLVPVPASVPPNGRPADPRPDPSQPRQPELSIVMPNSGSSWVTAAGTVPLKGTSTDNVTRVTWSADWGGSGTASGTQAWTIPTLGLQIGANVITVTATTADGRTARQTVTVTYLPLRAAK